MDSIQPLLLTNGDNHEILDMLREYNNPLSH
nr:MAG TPA: hypothetical protein [Caudoviricetes sp.]